jgi:hypothetical protein
VLLRLSGWDSKTRMTTKLLLVLVSMVILRSESHGIHDLILGLTEHPYLKMRVRECGAHMVRGIGVVTEPKGAKRLEQNEGSETFSFSYIRILLLP